MAGRIRADRVLRLPAPPHQYNASGGRPPRHGGEFDLKDPDSWPEPAVTTINETARYGKAAQPMWPWWSHTGANPGDGDRIWQAYLRRFDLEHTCRLVKQTLAGPGRSCATREQPAGEPGS
nr:transposase [Actinoplanes teichomyceticus]